MSVIFIDGFEYDSSQITKKYDSIGGSPVIAAGANAGSDALLLPTSTSSYVQKTVINSQVFTIGAAFKFTDNPVNDKAIFRIRLNTTDQCVLRLRSNKTIGIFFGNGNTVLGATSETYNINQWYYLEWSLLIDPDFGMTSLTVNGQTRIYLPTLNTQNAGTYVANQIRLGDGASGVLNFYYDNLYIDTQVTVRGPETRVLTIMPQTDGSPNTFTPIPTNQPDHASCVNQTTPDDDSTYVVSPLIGDEEAFYFETVPSGEQSIDAVQATAYAREDIGTPLDMTYLTRSTSSPLQLNPFNSTVSVNTSTYAYYPILATSNPITNSNWTSTDINAQKFSFSISTEFVVVPLP